MKLICPSCAAELPLADVNVATDVALCRACESHHRYSELAAVEPRIDLTRPPPGAWFERTPGGFEVGATARSPSAYFLLPFMVVWSGFSLGGIYGTQLVEGRFDPFRTLFGVPFLLGTGFLGSQVLMSVWGKVVVRVEGKEGSVFTGVGNVGRTRRFNWKEMKTARLSQGTTHGKRGSRTYEQITLEGQDRIDFGSALTTSRQHFVLAALKQMQARRS
jgi:hypothetical protein